jgi:predicted RNase H-like nuclease
MRTVLGIDAAWTETQPSGVALAEETERGWRLKAAASSYARFEAFAGLAPEPPAQRGMKPDAIALLAACRHLTGREPDLIAVDMPLSRRPIVRRRTSDLAVSVAYGAKKCATHSPSADRPGTISNELRAAFETCGYDLRTIPSPGESSLVTPALIEVYPHPALVELTSADERLRYKISKSNKYWPALKPSERREKLLLAWNGIAAALEQQIEGVTTCLPEVRQTDSGAALKGYEAALDAVVCAWVGVCALEGLAEAFGDAESAIWIPARDRKWSSRRAGQ